MNNDKLRNKYKEFADKFIEPYAENNEINGVLNKNIIDKLSEEKYIGAIVSTQYGGLNLSMKEIALLVEEVGRTSSATRNLLTVHGMVQSAIERFGTKDQKEKWLPKTTNGDTICAFALSEPDVGSDAKNIKTTAVKTDGGYIINGEKNWITMGQIASLYLVFTKVEDKITAFLIDRETEGLEVNPISNIAGLRGSMLAKLKFSNCFVSKENMLGQIGIGFNFIATYCLNYGRYTVALGSVGLAQACLDECLKYSSEREQFGKKINENQLIKKMLTEMIVNIQASRLLCQYSGELYYAQDPEYVMQIWSAKYMATKTLTRVANDAVQIFGAKGLCSDYKIERLYRASKVNEIIEGTTQMHEILIANHVINRSGFYCEN